MIVSLTRSSLSRHFKRQEEPGDEVEFICKVSSASVMIGFTLGFALKKMLQATHKRPIQSLAPAVQRLCSVNINPYSAVKLCTNGYNLSDT